MARPLRQGRGPRWKLSGNASSAGTLPPGSFLDFDDRGTEFAWGAGAQARLGNIGGRLEYERFNIPNTSEAQAIPLSLVLSFLQLSGTCGENDTGR